MEILHNEPINIDGHCGKVVLCYFSEDEEAASFLREELENSEFRVDFDKLDDDEALTHAAAEMGDRRLESAGAMVLFLGDSLLSGKNQPKRNLLFHRVGYFSAEHPDDLILCSYAKAGTGILKETPLQDTSVEIYKREPGEKESRVLEILRKTETGRDFSRLKRDRFFPDGEGAAEKEKSVERRLIYRRIGVKLSIYRADFEAARELYGAGNSGAGIGAGVFFDDLKKKITAGVRLFSFGHEDKMRPQLAPYDDERAIVISDYPKNFANRVELTLLPDAPEGEDAEIAFLRIDYILPVHSYLGLCCKPYIKGDRDLDGEVLSRLFAKNFLPQHDVKAKRSRLYYRFDFKDARPSAPAEEGVGSFADIVYPQ